jgi:hypothetical protein
MYLSIYLSTHAQGRLFCNKAVHSLFVCVFPMMLFAHLKPGMSSCISVCECMHVRRGVCEHFFVCYKYAHVHTYVYLYSCMFVYTLLQFCKTITYSLMPCLPSICVLSLYVWVHQYILTLCADTCAPFVQTNMCVHIIYKLEKAALTLA